MTETSRQSATSNLLHRITTSFSKKEASNKNELKVSKAPVVDKEEENVGCYPKWHTVVAGAVAGAGSRFLIAPLDLLKIRWQLGNGGNMFETFSGIIKQEGGITSLFRGNVAATYLWVGYAAVQFSLYARTHDWFTNMANLHHQSQPVVPLPPVVTQPLHWIGTNPTATAFCAGATAGIFATMATYPFDIARTTFAARGLTSTKAAASAILSSSASKNIPPKSLMEFCKQTYAQGGLRGFYVGSGPAVLQIIPYMGLNFALYDYLSNHGKLKDVLQSGWAGAIAGGTSKLLVYPLDTVKKRLQAQSYFSPSSGKYHHNYNNNMFQCIHHIATTEGITSFYRGLVPTVMKNMAATGLTFAIFTFTKKNLEAIHDSVEHPIQKKITSTKSKETATKYN